MLLLAVAGTFRTQKNYADAEAKYREAIRIAPSLPGAHLGFGTLLTLQERYSEAEAQFREGVRATNDSEVRVNLFDPTPSYRLNTLKDLKAKFAEFYFDLSEWKSGK